MPPANTLLMTKWPLRSALSGAPNEPGVWKGHDSSRAQ